MAIEEPDIKVPYSDPSINAQYSEFLKGEDLEDKYEAEDPLFETIKEEPVTIGGVVGRFSKRISESDALVYNDAVAAA